MPLLHAIARSAPPEAEQLTRTTTPGAEPQAPSAAPLSSSSAIALARTAASGDLVATRLLIESVSPRMRRTVQAVLGSGSPDVPDVLQQALIAFVHALPSFRGECEPHSFGARIAVRTAVAARKRARTRAANQDGVDVDTLGSSSQLPSEDLRAARRKELVLELLSDISPEQSESLALRFVLGWSVSEVARAMDVPPNTVRSRLRLAKEALRRRVGQNRAMAEELGVDGADEN